MVGDPVDHCYKYKDDIVFGYKLRDYYYSEQYFLINNIDRALKNLNNAKPFTGLPINSLIHFKVNKNNKLTYIT